MEPETVHAPPFFFKGKGPSHNDWWWQLGIRLLIRYQRKDLLRSCNRLQIEQALKGLNLLKGRKGTRPCPGSCLVDQEPEWQTSNLSYRVASGWCWATRLGQVQSVERWGHKRRQRKKAALKAQDLGECWVKSLRLRDPSGVGRWSHGMDWLCPSGLERCYGSLMTLPW